MRDLGERAWDFSWARTRSLEESGKTGSRVSIMRWRDAETGEEWFCKRMVSGVGTKQFNAFLDGEGERDHLIIHTRLVQSEDGDTMYLFPPLELHADDYTPQLELPDSHYRICARLSENDFRCRDERTGELRHVDGFRGPASLNWKDGGTHIFHDGEVIIGTDGWAHSVVNEDSDTQTEVLVGESAV